MLCRTSHFFLWLFLLIGLIVAAGLLFEGSQRKEVVFKEGGVIIQAEIADSQREKYNGLSGRESLSLNRGMLFILEEGEMPRFSMRDMKFGLDFIWISEEKVSDIDSNIPADFSGGISPEGKFDKVLEVPAGSVERLGIRVGDRVEIE